jgi:hypothetical protein
MSKDKMNKDHDSEREYLEELSPSLFKKKIEAEDKPPEGYFDTLGDRVMNRIDAQNSHRQNAPEKKVVRLVNWKNIGVAAAIAAVIATAQFIYLITKQDDPIAEETQTSFSEELGTADMETYLSEEDIYEAFASSDLSAGSILTEEDELEDELIIEYLLQEDLSEELIIEELES